MTTYSHASRFVYGFCFGFSAVFGLDVGFSLNHVCPSPQAIPEVLLYLWFLWIPVCIVSGLVWALISWGLARTPVITRVGQTVLFIVFAAIAIFGVTSACPSINF